ncbi:hypothetical protein H072_1949 [Dactylellina haptotyla CBS 200.50]|uniref:Uncharacterized protein n=1 Tax=Dactylellina haptotyla (strain CBS 200.50) TaxID=1284197 RepID=S8AM61_DACHA|nr:hypothetical protein H072_1949 [Dactylellina haptotyla CBS 200.50]
MSSTPSKRSKYANDEERKAAARERQRLYAARKRAEAKEAKLRAESLSTTATVDSENLSVDVGDVEEQQQPLTPSPTKAKRGPKKATAAEQAPRASNSSAVATAAAAAASSSPRKAAPRKKADHDDSTLVVVNGDNTFYDDTTTFGTRFEDSFSKTEIETTLDDDLTSPPSPSLSFSDGLNAGDFLPPPFNSTDHLLIPPQPSPTSQLNSFLAPSAPVQSYAIVHIPGNPGLVSYYTHFLTSLSHNLSNASIPNAQFTIFGASLGGFNVAPSPSDPALLGPDGYVSLQNQISRQIDMITHLLTSNPSLKIILTGHSLGAYLLLSAIHHISLSNPTLKKQIIGGIGLFPAVTHIAKSPSGRRLSPFLNLAGLIPFIVGLANIIVAIIPAVVWGWLVRIFMPAFESPARAATVSFLKSPKGVRQGLCLGRDELLGIKEDVWDEGVWGGEGVADSTELVFYFGEKDHWVFNEEREKLIAARARGGTRWVEDDDTVFVNEKDGWKPRMLVCGEGIRHSFCVSTQLSETMAAKTARWVEDIVTNDRIKNGM